MAVTRVVGLAVMLTYVVVHFPGRWTLSALERICRFVANRLRDWTAIALFLGAPEMFAHDIFPVGGRAPLALVCASYLLLLFASSRIAATGAGQLAVFRVQCFGE